MDSTVRISEMGLERNRASASLEAAAAVREAVEVAPPLRPSPELTLIIDCWDFWVG